MVNLKEVGELIKNKSIRVFTHNIWLYRVELSSPDLDEMIPDKPYKIFSHVDLLFSFSSEQT